MIEPMKPINEFQGFEIFVPSHDPGSSRIQLTISKTGCRISKAALSELKYPEYVNAFFDRNGKRLMISAADKRMQNIMKLSKQGTCPNTIGQQCFIKMLETVCGMILTDGRWVVIGKKAGKQTSVIFNLSEIQSNKERK